MSNTILRVYLLLSLLNLLGLPAAANTETAQQKQQRLGVALLAAVRGHNLALVRRLLAQGADPDYVESEDIYLDYVDGGVNSYQYTKEYAPLWEAVMTRQPAIVRLLLDQGADPDLGGQLQQNSGLCLAVETQQPEIVSMLLARGAQPDCLVVAVKSGNRQIVRNLLAQGLNPADGLETAIGMPEPDMLIFLLESGAQLQQAPATLSAAVEKDDPALLRLLLGSSRSSLDPVLMSDALYLALHKNKPATVQLLLAYTPRIDSHSGLLWAAVGKQPPELIASLLDRGANPDLVSKNYGHASLLEDAATADLATIELLYSHGARYRPEAVMKRAAGNPDPRVPAFFLQHAAQQNVQECPLCVAAMYDRRVQVAELLDQGTDIEAVNNWGGPLYGMSALTVASLFANFEVVETLLARGADLKRSGNLIYRIVTEPRALEKYRLQNYASSEPMWQRDIENYRRLILLFRAKGVDIDESFAGETALMAAVQAKAYPFVESLLQAGANSALKNHQGKTALDLARAQESEYMVRILVQWVP